MSSDPPPVAVDQYTEEYFLERVGGAEFFRLYGPKVLKPALAYALKRAAVEAGMEALDLGCGRGNCSIIWLKRAFMPSGLISLPRP